LAYAQTKIFTILILMGLQRNCCGWHRGVHGANSISQQAAWISDVPL